MPHHGSDLGQISAEIAKQLGLGATERFPQGKLNAFDEGELRLAIVEQEGKVCIHFGKPVAWIGFDPIQAMELAATIRKRALEACAGKLSPQEAAILVQGNEVIDIGSDGKATIKPL